MSLDNIQLPAIVLQDLYKNSLVDIDTGAVKKSSKKTAGLAFLGNNQKQVTIIANDDTSIYLPDEELNFLMGILNACKLTMADVALVNIAKTGTITYNEIEQQLHTGTMLLFGVAPLQLQLPLQFPHYQIQKFNGLVYLAAPALTTIAADKVEKTKLWNCLKQIFSIA
jgi:hypothetical protein